MPPDDDDLDFALDRLMPSDGAAPAASAVAPEHTLIPSAPIRPPANVARASQTIGTRSTSYGMSAVKPTVPMPGGAPRVPPLPGVASRPQAPARPRPAMPAMPARPPAPPATAARPAQDLAAPGTANAIPQHKIQSSSVPAAQPTIEPSLQPAQASNEAGKPRPSQQISEARSPSQQLPAVGAPERRSQQMAAAPSTTSAHVDRTSAGGFPVLRPPARQHKPSVATSLLPDDQQFPLPPPQSAEPTSASVARKAIEISEDTQIDRFGLIREIARGGMGQVFLARDTKLGRKVAIKFLLNDDPNLAQRFLIEARATARCTHENIVAIYEVGEHLGLPYMVLEYLEGKTLSQVLETKPGPKVFAEIMLSVARALERAHEHGIVHRDLKPSNIFVTDRGQVKVLDFGVARIFDSAGDAMEQAAAASGKERQWDSTTSNNTYVTFSGGGTLVGTLPYMSPEQWGSDTVDHQSDIWACGIMFWRSLTGVHPAGTMNADKLRARLSDLETPLPSIGARDATLPVELVHVVDRCLAKKKSERYQNASEMIEDLQAYLAPKADRVSEDQCPYRGLAAFGENDAKFFFGRSNEIRTALAQLEGWPLLAVIGPSGVGKSSFVHAGLVPAVRGTGGNWQVRILRPGRSPLQSLATTLDENIETGQIAAEVVDQLHEAPGLYGELLRKAVSRKKHKVLIVVDQLEELFTLSDNDEVRKLFLAALLAAADDTTSPVRVVLSMRADFLDRLAGHKHFLSELSRGLFFLSAPDADNLRETLVRPAELAGYAFGDPWIVEDMMQAATSKGALPLLQFAATRLWDSRDRAKKQLTIAAYNQMGGVGGAFARHADEIASAVPPQSQRLLRAIMTRLVTPEGTRAVVDRNELLGLSSDRDEIERILDQLVRARLILMHTDPAQGTTVEIVHEVLISEWPTLARWLEDSQALRGFMMELRQATKQWLARNKASDLVWRGATAQEALATQKRHVLELSESEKDYLEAVRVQMARSRRRKVAVLTTVFLVLALVIAGGAFFTVRLSQANAEAQQALVEAEKAAEAARAAEAKVQAQLDEVKAAQARREQAEQEAAARAAEASKANQQVAQSQEDLAKANLELQKRVEEAQKAKEIAQELAKKAATAKELAEKATQEAKAANARTSALLEREKDRVRQLEAEKSKISTGGLK
jgi:eukaryotic-like serine/threonine-protein kinase